MDPTGHSTWECKACTLINKVVVKACEACGTVRHESNTSFSKTIGKRINNTSSDDYTQYSLSMYTRPSTSGYSEASGTNAMQRDSVDSSSMLTYQETSHKPQESQQCNQCTFIDTCILQICKTCGRRHMKSLSSGFSSMVMDQLAISAPQDSDHNRAAGVRNNEIRIVLIGKTGSGKSATGNTILGLSGYFESLVCGESITKNCKRGEAFRYGKNLLVVDTPGLFDTNMANNLVTKEILKCIGMTSPGPHAFVLVVQIGRFTKEEKDTVIQFANTFGEGMYNHLIVLFTRKDDLDRQGMGIDEYVTKVPEDLKQILHKCGKRYIAFNNSAPNHLKEMCSIVLIEMVEQIVHQNGGSFYTNEMYEQAEEALERRMKEILREEKEKMEKEIKEIQTGITRKYELLIDQEKKERKRIEDNVKNLKEEKKEDEEKMEKLREEQEESKRQQRELLKAIKQQTNVRESEQEMAKMRQYLQEQIQNEMKIDRERLKNELREEKRVKEIKEKEAEKEMIIQRESQNRKIMQSEQEHHRMLREAQFRKSIAAEKLRDKARDDCEGENQGMMSAIWSGFKNGAKKVRKFFRNTTA